MESTKSRALLLAHRLLCAFAYSVHSDIFLMRREQNCHFYGTSWYPSKLLMSTPRNDTERAVLLQSIDAGSAQMYALVAANKLPQISALSVIAGNGMSNISTYVDNLIKNNQATAFYNVLGAEVIDLNDEKGLRRHPYIETFVPSMNGYTHAVFGQKPAEERKRLSVYAGSAVRFGYDPQVWRQEDGEIIWPGRQQPSVPDATPARRHG